MGLLSKLTKRFMPQGPGWQPPANWQPDDYLPPTVGMFTGGRSDAGVHVDEYTSLTASTVYACCSVISNTISCLPLAVMHKTDATKQIDHPVFKVLHENPNQFMSAPVFRETMMLNLLLWGACFAYIEKN